MKQYLKSIYNEDIALSALKSIKKQKYYHGTQKAGFGEKIVKEGIKPPDLSMQPELDMTPRKGKVYITSNLKYGVIYCVGMNMLGEEAPAFLLKPENRYGYLFVIDGNNLKLKNFEPDEDSVGELFSKHEGMKPDKAKKKFPWLFELANIHLNDEELEGAEEGEYSYYAVIGKKLIPKMTKEQKLDLIINGGAHVAHEGRIVPNESWKFDKKNLNKLKKDGSNFFKLAKKIKKRGNRNESKRQINT